MPTTPVPTSFGGRPPAWLQHDLLKNAGAFSFSASLAITGPETRFRTHLSLSFPATEVVSVRKEGDQWELTLGLPGLYGCNSPLPTSYTEDLLAEQRNDGVAPVGRGLFDLIHERLYRLLADVLSHHRDAPYHTQVLSLFTGLADRSLGGTVPGVSLLAWAGLLGGRCRGADSLERLVSGWTHLPCEVEECIPLWTPLSTTQRTRLGRENNVLGTNCITGDWILSRATAFRITLGPVHWSAAEGWFSGGSHLAELLALIDLMNPDALDVEVVLRIDTQQMPCPALGYCQLGRDVRTSGPSPDQRSTVVYRSTGPH